MYFLFRLRLLRFNRRLSLLHLTIAKSSRQILGFLLVFLCVFVAFTSLFYLLFYTQSSQFATWIDTCLTCFEMISLHFSTVKDLKKINPLLAGLCLFLFIFLAVFLLTNMFVSIIVDNFKQLRQKQSNRADEVELIKFTIQKMKQWLGNRFKRQN
jgi:predicted PurR-regulated permease PerM